MCRIVRDIVMETIFSELNAKSYRSCTIFLQKNEDSCVRSFITQCSTVQKPMFLQNGAELGVNHIHQHVFTEEQKQFCMIVHNMMMSTMFLCRMCSTRCSPCK